MYIPMVRERVRVSGRRGEFVVTRVDYHHESADLSSAAADESSLRNVNFRELFATWEDPEQANRAAAD